MSYNPQPGMSVHDLDTPALLLDLDAFQFNLQKMASFFAGKPCGLRPHIKTHKCPTIALKQLESGAVGITCAKVSEAEVMASAGVQNILIANQVTGPVKLDRLTDLAQRCSVMVAVDDADNVRALEQACSAKNARLKVLIEVDIGMHRCGVTAGAPAVQLARQIAESPHLTFMGLQAYEGHAVLTADPQERALKVQEAFAPVRETCELLERAGLPARTVSGGGTGTYDITGNLPPVNEVQAGSYVFMDSTYGAVRPEFKNSLSVLTTVVSRTVQGGLVVDAGLKAMSKEFGWPQPVGLAGASVRGLSEEHGVLDLAEPERVSVHPGDKVSFIPSHCCTTTNLYDQLHVVQNGVLVDIWPIAARGRAQ